MAKIFNVPRVNALGLKGPEKATEKILEGVEHELIDVKNDNVELDEEKIFETALKSYNKRNIFVGGDHSITYPIGKAFLHNYWEENCFIIIFDAHPDLMSPMKEPTHEEFAKGLLELGWKPENMVFIGLRKIDPIEQKVIEQEGIKVFTTEPNEEILKYLREKAIHKRVYLSIDIDALDPSVVGAVNYPVEGGLTRERFDTLLDGIFNGCNVWNADLVEYVPEKDDGGKSLVIAREIFEQVRRGVESCQKIKWTVKHKNLQEELFRKRGMLRD